MESKSHARRESQRKRVLFWSGACSLQRCDVLVGRYRDPERAILHPRIGICQHAGIEGGWVRDRSANQRPTDHPPGNGAHPATHRSRRHSRGHPVNSSDHLEHQSPVITTGTLLAQNGIPWNAGVANGATNFSEFGKRNELGGWNERTF